jgi:ketosteroid isomerase-like protein
MKNQTISSEVITKTATRVSEIGHILKRYSESIEIKDLEGILKLFADDVVIFDLMTPFQYVGNDAVRERLTDWFKGYTGAIQFDFDQLQIHASETIAVAHALVQCGGTIVNDLKPTSMWLRVTFTFKSFDGLWLIVHEHTSEPFDMETGRVVQQRESH